MKSHFQIDLYRRIILWAEIRTDLGGQKSRKEVVLQISLIDCRKGFSQQESMLTGKPSRSVTVGALKHDEEHTNIGKQTRVVARVRLRNSRILRKQESQRAEACCGHDELSLVFVWAAAAPLLLQSGGDFDISIEWRILNHRVIGSRLGSALYRSLPLIGQWRFQQPINERCAKA